MIHRGPCAEETSSLRHRRFKVDQPSRKSASTRPKRGGAERAVTRTVSRSAGKTRMPRRARCSSRSPTTPARSGHWPSSGRAACPRIGLPAPRLGVRAARGTPAPARSSGRAGDDGQSGRVPSSEQAEGPRGGSRVTVPAAARRRRRTEPASQPVLQTGAGGVAVGGDLPRRCPPARIVPRNVGLAERVFAGDHLQVGRPARPAQRHAHARLARVRIRAYGVEDQRPVALGGGASGWCGPKPVASARTRADGVGAQVR